MKVGSICSGAGIHLHGWADPAWAIECNKEIADCYRNNHGNNVIVDYVQNIDVRELELVECLVATPSCKNASNVNNKAETKQDLEVADSICNFLKYLQPKCFILENVVGYCRFRSFEKIICQLEGIGYVWQINRFNLADFGIAQNRSRIYLIASRSPLPVFLFSTHQSLGWYEAIKDLIGDLPESQIAPWQSKLMEKWEIIPPPPFAIKKVGANYKSYKPLFPDAPAPTVRAFGRSCDNHWQQMNVITADGVKVVTPAAALRLFGRKEIADAIVLPENKVVASECVGNGASWEIFNLLTKYFCGS